MRRPWDPTLELSRLPSPSIIITALIKGTSGSICAETRVMQSQIELWRLNMQTHSSDRASALSFCTRFPTPRLQAI
jgi:hypothetical protein